MDKHTHPSRSRGDAQDRLSRFQLPGFVGNADIKPANTQTLRRLDAQPKVEDDDAAECRMENEGGPPSSTPAPSATAR